MVHLVCFFLMFVAMGFIASNVIVCNSLFSVFFIGKKWELHLNKYNIVRARLVNCNGNYIKIRIGIIRNKRWCIIKT